LKSIVERHLKENTPLARGDNDFLNDLPPDTPGLPRGSEDAKAKREFVKMATAVKSFYLDFWTNLGYNLASYSKRYDVLKKPVRDLMVAIFQVYKDIHNEYYNSKNEQGIKEGGATSTTSVGAFAYDAPVFGDRETTKHHDKRKLRESHPNQRFFINKYVSYSEGGSDEETITIPGEYDKPLIFKTYQEAERYIQAIAAKERTRNQAYKDPDDENGTFIRFLNTGTLVISSIDSDEYYKIETDMVTSSYY
jgi:hypothetical protein